MRKSLHLLAGLLGEKLVHLWTDMSYVTVHSRLVVRSCDVSS